MFKVLRACVDAYTTQAVSFMISEMQIVQVDLEQYIAVGLVLKEVGSDIEKFLEEDLRVYLTELFGNCFGDLKVVPKVGDVFTIGLTACFWKGKKVDLKTQFPELKYRLEKLVNLNCYLAKLRSAGCWQNHFGFSETGFIDKLPLTDWLESWVELANYTYFRGSALVNLQTNSVKIGWICNNQSPTKTRLINAADYTNQLGMKILPGAKAVENRYLLVWKGVVYAASSVGIYGVCRRKESYFTTALVDWSVVYHKRTINNGEVVYRTAWTEYLRRYQREDSKISNLDLIMALAELLFSSELLIFEKGSFESVHCIYKVKYPISCEYELTPLNLRQIDYFRDLVIGLETDALSAAAAIWAEVLEAEAEAIEAGLC